MITGLFFALGACFVWGLIFIIPSFLGDYSSLEVALGRYFSYGILSFVLLFRKGWSIPRRIPLRAWGMAAIFGLISNVLYYIGVVVGLRYATAPVTVLILGMCPILVAFYGNWQTKECSYRSLVFPCMWMVIGMILVNISEIDWTFTEYSASQYLLGLVCIIGSLLSWSWYAVNNARFLKKNINVPRSEWSTLIGVGTLIWVLLGVFILEKWASEEVFYLKKFLNLAPESLRFFGWIAVLGVICSWLGCYLWNQASSYLPISLMGPFIIFETIFGLLFVYSVDLRFPSWLELIGVFSMLGGLLLSIYLFKRQTQSSEEISH